MMKDNIRLKELDEMIDVVEHLANFVKNNKCMVAIGVLGVILGSILDDKINNK